MKWTYLAAGVGLLAVGAAVAGMDIPNEELSGKEATAAELGAYTEQQVIDYVAQYEATEQAEKGKYTQVLADKTAPEAKEQIPTNVKSDLPPMEVHVYDSPKGKGYQVIFERTRTVTATSTKGGDYTVPQTRSVGYGPEAKERTWDWRDYR